MTNPEEQAVSEELSARVEQLEKAVMALSARILTDHEFGDSAEADEQD